jgi:uncharacterized protein (TIGR03503 family)
MHHVQGYRIWILLLLMSLIGGMTDAVAAENEVPEIADTRILIDVSGSMKKNDPQNLRRPALRLLVELLPEDSRAGVWIFGRWVNMQVPLGKVDKEWRELARDGADKIHSRGLFTNIEDALKRSSADWEGASKKYQRHLILLTDGMVDISKDPAESEASRGRILNEILPRLKEYGVRIHTVALSERADHELLRRLAEETDGWYEQVNDATQLQRIFLRLFEKVSKPDTVPLKDNRFQVDDSISEVTLLVFRAEGAEPTRVIPPGGEGFTAKDAPSFVRWHRDVGYDLLTITKPAVGEWQVQAAMDPDNRVLVVTDLKMQSSDLPNRMLQGDRVPLSAFFTDHGNKITDREFLDVVNLRSEHTDSEGAGEPRPLHDDGQNGDPTAGDGEFTVLLGDGVAPGKVDLTLTAEGKTFVRERHYSFEVQPAVTLETKEEERDGKPGTLVRLVPDPELLDPATIHADGRLVSKDGEITEIAFAPGEDGKALENWVDRSGLTGSWELGVSFGATSKSGTELAMDLGPVYIEGTLQPPPEPKPEPEAAPEPAPEPVPPEEPPPPPPPEESGLLGNMLIFGIINLFLLAGLGFWFYRWRAGRSKVELVEEEGGEAPGAVNSAPPEESEKDAG